MTGQQIYIRTKDTYGNAGSWTAALTPGIIDKETLRQIIEPNCTLEEQFAGRFPESCGTAGIFRIYRAANAVVTSRTQWVSDRITEKNGRRCAFCHSRIRNGEDALRLIRDPLCVFDPEEYLDYQLCADSILRGDGLNGFLLEKERSRKAFPGMPGRSIMERCGIDRFGFGQLLRMLYYAIGRNARAAVVLPGDVRCAWEQTGDPAAEQLARLLLMLLPDFTRARLGICTHSGCRLPASFGNIHLYFVHPASEADLKLLRQSGCMIMRTGTAVSTAAGSAAEAEDDAVTGMPEPAGGDSYAEFLFDHIGDYDRIRACWEFMKQRYASELKTGAADYRLLTRLFSEVRPEIE